MVGKEFVQDYKDAYRMSGSDTISISPAPALFRSIEATRLRLSVIDFPVS